MFRRRNKLPVRRRVREWLWPSAGWRRSSRYLMHRVLRLNDSPSSIAAGLACGSAVAFTPFVGLHIVLSAIFAWVIRGNVIASAVATLVVGNPWALPLIWVWIYQLGRWLLGIHGGHGLPADLTFSHVIAHPMQILLPVALGSAPSAAAVWFIVYWPAKLAIQRVHDMRRRRTAQGRTIGAVAPSKRAAR
jgi:uncharacterized protein (DUF2062 family)